MTDRPQGCLRWWREPLLQFLVLGALVAAGQAWWNAVHDEAARRIVVDDGRVAALRGLHEAQFGQAPTEEELQHLVSAHVREEVLYREALARGLDQDDEILRRRLVAKLEFLLTDASVPGIPADAVLQRHLAAHSGRFSAPSRSSFHNRFAEDRATLERLRPSLPSRPPLGSTPGSDGTDPWQPGLAPADIQARFGNSPLLQALPTMPLKQWTGPWQSGLGWHLVYVESRSEPAPLPWAALREAVLRDWMGEERLRLTREAIDTLVAEYAVELPPTLTPVSTP